MQGAKVLVEVGVFFLGFLVVEGEVELGEDGLAHDLGGDLVGFREGGERGRGGLGRGVVKGFGDRGGEREVGVGRGRERRGQGLERRHCLEVIELYWIIKKIIL